MSTRIRIFTAGAAISFPLTAVPDAAEEGKEQSPSGHFAEIMETLLAEMTATQYQHKTEIDEGAGVLKGKFRVSQKILTFSKPGATS